MSRVQQNSGGIPMSTMAGASQINQAGDSARQNQNGGTPVQRVFIQRDYREGIAIRFVDEFPQELLGRIEPAEFVHTIMQINEIFKDAERFDCATFCESCMGFLTASLWWWCTDTKYQKALKRLSKLIAERNQCLFIPNGLMMVDPLERGLRVIEISIISSEPPRS